MNTQNTQAAAKARSVLMKARSVLMNPRFLAVILAINVITMIMNPVTHAAPRWMWELQWWCVPWLTWDFVDRVLSELRGYLSPEARQETNTAKPGVSNAN